MTVQVVDTAEQERAERKTVRWTTPDYEVVETSLEVTAYLFGSGS